MSNATIGVLTWQACKDCAYSKGVKRCQFRRQGTASLVILERLNSVECEYCAEPGDYVLTNPVKPDIFAATYEEVSE